MRRYLRCPGAICCPARRALRAGLQPHIRFCDELIVVDRSEHVGELLGLVGERLGSVLKHRLQHGEHRQGDPRLLALFRLRSTGLGVAVGAIRSCRGRYRPRASPRSPNGPTRARLKPRQTALTLFLSDGVWPFITQWAPRFLDKIGQGREWQIWRARRCSDVGQERIGLRGVSIGAAHQA